MQHMRRAYNLQIGEQSAERIKIGIGSMYPLDQEMTMDVAGKDVMAACPRKVTVTSEEIREAMREPIEAIIRAIKDCLETTPPEIAADLCERGIVMCGGSSIRKRRAGSMLRRGLVDAERDGDAREIAEFQRAARVDREVLKNVGHGERLAEPA